ncbi:MAG: endonuclease MutS2 [Lachnospiraceae bacterium]|nr:endonuclease MutS2 [Lachnospiraceae bacterium]
MNKRVLSVLEFDKITEMLADHATSEPGKRMCRQLVPCPDLSDAKRALQETADAMRRAEAKGRVSFGANRDFSELFSSLAIGATLDMGRLLQTASFLENVARVREYGRGKQGTRTGDETPAGDTLTDFFSALDARESAVAEIRRCILSEDEMAPDASAALRDIRRNRGIAEGRIRETLNRMVNGSLREYLQDAVVTMRGDRFCLPVRAEHKTKVNGIVHDQSSSGSTFFIEPAAVVELNNKIREYDIQEQKEIARILASLSAMLSDNLDALRDNATYMTLLDFIFAKAAFAFETDAAVPVFTNDQSFRLIQARHPLIDKKKVVPTDIYLGHVPEGDDFRMMVITGPNTGGKTVTLKTTGLLILMGEAGLAIPADAHSEIAFFREVFADIGDEQSIEQSLSTFSSHMTNTVRILNEAEENDLCLFDELGAGTDPTEGAALAIAILNNLLSRGVSVLATTHYAELKVFAMTTAGVKNANCEFDVATLKPTYRLLIGTPGKSNAFAIASKLGLPQSVIDGAHAQIDTDKARMETLFTDLEESRKQVEAEKASVARYKEEISRLEARMREQSEEFDTLGQDLIAEAREEADRVLAGAKAFADETIRLMRKAGADENLLKELERTRTALNEKRGKNRKEKDVRREKDKEEHRAVRLKTSDLVPGTSVKIVSLDLKGTIEGHPDKNGNLFVQCGVMRMKTNVSDLELAKEEEAAKSGQEIAKRFSMRRAFETQGSDTKTRKGTLRAAGAAAEINLIGKNTDDALSALDKYLDDAYLSHMPSVRIVHGKGTGTLRNAVQRHLKQISYVKSFQTGEYGEGDAGVTIVKLKE